MDLIVYLVGTVLFCIVAGGFSWLSCNREELENNPLFHVLGFALGGGLGLVSILNVGHFGYFIFLAFLGPLLGCVLFAPFVARSAIWAGGRVKRAYMGDDRIAVIRSYDQAEKAETRKEWDRAIRIYREMMELDLHDHEAPMRIGEIEVSRGSLDEAISWFRESVSRGSTPRDRMVATFRICELEGEAGRYGEAVRLLENLLEDEIDEGMSRHVKARLARLKDR